MHNRAISPDLAGMWQSGSERRGVATDEVALQKRREDGFAS